MKISAVLGQSQSVSLKYAVFEWQHFEKSVPKVSFHPELVKEVHHFGFFFKC